MIPEIDERNQDQYEGSILSHLRMKVLPATKSIVVLRGGDDFVPICPRWIGEIWPFGISLPRSAPLIPARSDDWRMKFRSKANSLRV